MPRVLFVFVDGIGLGRPGAQNPLDGAPVSILACLGGRREPAPGVHGAALDATLGYPGLPQSATGQGVLFTGDDVIGLSEGHRSGYPSAKVAAVLGRRSILKRARDAGKASAFLNAFEPRRAEHMLRVARGEALTPRHRGASASGLAAAAGSGTLRTFEDAANGTAATFDLTGEVCRAFGLEAPCVTLGQAACAVARGASEVDLALFEMFLTDKAGHAQDVTWARREIVRVERFLEELFHAIDPREQLVVVTSDHGNLEDLSTRGHTRAKVPLLAYGAGAAGFVSGLCPLGSDEETERSSLLEVAPRLLEAAVAPAAPRADGGTPPTGDPARGELWPAQVPC
jgi:hypothetical protein